MTKNLQKSVVVTLADENYLDSAKQLLSSVYYNSGWRGDYLLLAQDVSDERLNWFKKRGILIKKCIPLEVERIRTELKVRVSKYHLFTSYFKKWDHVIFLDADIMVRASIDELLKVKHIGAIPDLGYIMLKTQFGPDNSVSKSRNRKVYKKIKKKYNLEKLAYNTGVISFNTDIIKANTFDELVRFTKEYGLISHYGDQGILNLFFYGKWECLPIVFNLCPKFIIDSCWIKPEDIKGILIHRIMAIKKPLESRLILNEWNQNMKNAESINLAVRLPPKCKWTKDEIIAVSKYYDKKMGELPNLRMRLMTYERKINLKKTILKYEKMFNVFKNILPMFIWDILRKILTILLIVEEKIRIVIGRLFPFLNEYLYSMENKLKFFTFSLNQMLLVYDDHF